MRLTTPLKTVLAGSAALALLTACGGGSDDTASSSSSASTSSAAGSSSAEQSSEAPDADAAAFCSDTQSAFADLDTAFTSAGDDLTAIPTLLSEASDRLQSIEAPADISQQWTSFTDAVGAAADGVQGLDLTTPEGQQQFATVFGQLEATATEDQAAVQAYIEGTCGFDLGEQPSAAPTS